MGINRNAAISSYGISYVIPTEDEWYKAAYFKPDGSGYSLYANGTDTAPIAGVQSNYRPPSPWNIGTGTVEQNGTFDMMGNVWEWNETLSNSWRGIRGGSYDLPVHYAAYYLTSSSRAFSYPYDEFHALGFRVASVPEPTSALIMAVGAAIVALRRRHR